MAHSEAVQRVNTVTLDIEKKQPPILVVQATGVVPTLGYTDARLEPYVYVVPPADGYYEFTFVADAPQGAAGEVVSAVEAHFAWEEFPADLRGVRVHAAQNSLEAALTSA